jgi:hypothetical protein
MPAKYWQRHRVIPSRSKKNMPTLFLSKKDVQSLLNMAEVIGAV